ncbi:MAG: kinase/pyrophosphorylase [Eubacteriaceae bacterium]|nr:kinase/pyrophosphorylase [Eubacteriaceae bacterium]
MAKFHVFLVSDSIGETANVVFKTALSQFCSDDFDVYTFPFIKTYKDVDVIIKRAKEYNAIVIYTVVLKDINSYLKSELDKNGIKCQDLLIGTINMMRELSGLEPKYIPGQNRLLDENYFKRMEAIEFAVQSDDGKSVSHLRQADVILLGVSRTSKTPICVYLANQNIKAANYPIVYGFEPDKNLFKIPRRKMIGLTIDPEKLHIIRSKRISAYGIDHNSSYAEMSNIKKELEYADDLFKRLNINVINTSNNAIEETASIIINLIKDDRYN